MPPEERQDGFERLGQEARRSYRMVKDDQQTIAPDDAQALIGELKDWRRDHATSDGRPCPWKKVAEFVGVAVGTLQDVVNGRYKADPIEVLKKIDRALADDRARMGRFDPCQHAEITLTRKINGVINTAIRNNSMAVIIGEPGSGKSVHARAFAAERGGVVIIRPDETFNDARGVSYLLCGAIEGLRTFIHKTHPRRLAAVRSYLQKHRNLVLVVDECQQLAAEGLNCLRNLHDTSDPEGRRCTPVILFGDEGFYRLIVKSRNGERSPIAPQLTRRLYPIFNITRDGAAGDGDAVFTVEDVVRIIRNDRVRVVTPQGIRWITKLANIRGFGSLGFSIAVLRMAFDLTQADLVDVPDLVMALRMAVGPRAMEEADQSADGELLRRVG